MHNGSVAFSLYTRGQGFTEAISREVTMESVAKSLSNTLAKMKQLFKCFGRHPQTPDEGIRRHLMKASTDT